jgi:glycosyltransferase involved in cell wall biosynthesis
MGENARKRAEKEFSLEKMLEETEKVYNMIVD